MDGATDWQLQVDLDGKLKVPEEVVETNLRPDNVMILVSRNSKRIGVNELTVPSEERIEVSYELKRSKYAVLQAGGKRKGWAVAVWTVELGCRSFPASSIFSLLRDLGIEEGERRKGLKQIGESAEKATNAILNWSRMKDWSQKK